jgi:hypothetical protein
MNKTRILYLVLAVAAAIWLGSRFFGDEAGKIRGRLEEIRDLIEKSAGEGALEGVSRSTSFAELFAEPFEAEVSPAGQRLGDKGRLMQVFVGFRHASERVTLDYRAVEIVVAENQREAGVTLEALLNGGPAGMLAGEAFPVELRFRKVDGDWLVARAWVGDPIRRGVR